MNISQPCRRATAPQTRMTPTAFAIALLVTTVAGPAQALEISTGNEDLTVRWDNQIRYNAGVRAEKLNPDFANNPTTDATENSVKRGSLVMNRLDLLTEVDVVYQRKFGFRVSGAAWNDFSVGSTAKGSATVAAAGFPPEYTNNQYNAYTKRFVKGPSGELLDAFVFGSFNAGSVPVNLKLGNHVVYWGEGLFNLFHSISYSQAPLNLLKATSSPGIEAKEVFMPIGQLSAQAQLSENLSLAGQWMLDWKPSRLPPGGTYFGAADATRADFVSAGPGFAFPVGPDAVPDKKRNQFGVNLRWSPQWLEGTAGLYYRRFNEVMPWAFLRMGSTFIPAVGGPMPQDLHLAFAKDTEMYAVSLAKNVSGVNLGVDLSYRKNTALNSTTTPLDPTVFGFQGREGARGNTWHLLANTIYLLPKTALFEGGSLQAEFVYSRLDKVTRNANLFFGEGTVGCPAGVSATDAGCATKNYMGLQVGGNFDYPQALPGVNLSVPFSVSYGLKGNAANVAGGYQNNLNWSLGLQANYLNAHEFTLKYNDSRTPYTVLPTGAIRQNGATAVSNNHGWVSFTYKTSF